MHSGVLMNGNYYGDDDDEEEEAEKRWHCSWCHGSFNLINFVNFSLIAVALGYRAIVSVSTDNYWFLLNGLIGFVIFLILGNLFYLFLNNERTISWD